jgi:hypothetical protein
VPDSGNHHRIWRVLNGWARCHRVAAMLATVLRVLSPSPIVLVRLFVTRSSYLREGPRRYPGVCRSLCRAVVDLPSRLDLLAVRCLAPLVWNKRGIRRWLCSTALAILQFRPGEPECATAVCKSRRLSLRWFEPNTLPPANHQLTDAPDHERTRARSAAMSSRICSSPANGPVGRGQAMTTSVNPSSPARPARWRKCSIEVNDVLRTSRLR